MAADGANLNSQACQRQGFDTGELACAADRLTFDTAAREQDKDGGGSGAGPITGAFGIWIGLVGLWATQGRRGAYSMTEMTLPNRWVT